MTDCKLIENPWIKCSHPAWDEEGLCLLHSRREDKDKDGKFSLEIEDKLNKKEYDFAGVYFINPISFHGYIFNNLADFKGAIFTQDADFSFSTFNRMAEFDGAIFLSTAHFSDVTFTQRADFHGATFAQNVNFTSTAFYSEADFYRTTFTKEAFFLWTYFGGWTRFVYLNPQREDRPAAPPIVSGVFHGIRLHKEATLLFQDVCLAGLDFSGTDVKELTFRNVEWVSYHPPFLSFLIKYLHLRWQKWFRGRQVLLNEIRLREKNREVLGQLLKYGCPAARRKLSEVKLEDYARVEEIYRGLKLNYGEAGDFKRVGDFHYGEMEMHRLASPWRWLPVYWYNLYRFLSGYGERPLWAFLILLGLLFGLTGLAWSWGLAFKPGVASSSPVVGYWDALVFILEKATLQRPDWLVPQNLVSRVFAGLSVLLIPGQAALFILALRNRLGRRR